MGEMFTNSDLMRAFGQLEGKIDGMMRLYAETVDRLVDVEKRLDSRFETVQKRIEDRDEELDKRLRTVEKRLFAYGLVGSGIWAIILALAGAATGFFK